MNYNSHSLAQTAQNISQQLSKDELVKQIAELIEWKQKATVELEHFRTSCILFNFCDINPVNELLKN